MKIDHIGIAVADIEVAKKEYIELGFSEHGNICCDVERKIQVQYLINGSIKIELVMPLEQGVPSPVDRFVGKGKAYAMYHICYETFDILTEIQKMKQDGYLLLEEPRESKAMDNRVAAYLFHSRLGLVELVENNGC